MGSIHLRPNTSVTEKKGHLREVASAYNVVGPDALFLGGDFNGTFESVKSLLQSFTEGSRTGISLGLKCWGLGLCIKSDV